MLQALIGPISGLVGSWMDEKTEEQKELEAKQKALVGSHCFMQTTSRQDLHKAQGSFMQVIGHRTIARLEN